MFYDVNSISNSALVQIVDDNGKSVTGLLANTWPDAKYAWFGTSTSSGGGGWTPAVDFGALNDLSTYNSNYNSGGVFEFALGYYRLDVPNEAFSHGQGVVRLMGEQTGLHLISPELIVANLVRTDDLVSGPDNFSALGITPSGHISNVDSVNGYGAGEDPATLVWAKTMTELTAVPGVTDTILKAMQWMFLLSRNKILETATSQQLRNNADNATIGTSVIGDDGTTFTRGPYG